MNRKERIRRRVQAHREGKCWVHEDKLVKAITKPFEGLPTDEISKVDGMFPYHALYSHVGCMPLPPDKSHGQLVNMCPSCNKEAKEYLSNHKDEAHKEEKQKNLKEKD